jgi:hypothetical protein
LGGELMAGTYQLAPGVGGANVAQSMPLARGQRGTAQTIAAMRRLVDSAIKNQQINRLAVAIVQGTPDFQDMPKAQAIFNWVRQNIRFISDPVGKEALRTPIETLTVAAGDCDCITTLIAALLGTIGIPAAAVTVSTNPEDPNSFSHVYPEAFVDGAWVPMDCARPGAQFGLAPQHIYLSKRWNLFGEESERMSGLLHGYGMNCATMGRGTLGRGSLGRIVLPSRSSAGMRGLLSRGTLGDDSGFDIGDLSSVITPQLVSSVTTGTANIITAERASPLNLVPYTGGAIPAGYTVNSAGQLVQASTISSGTLLIGVLLIAGLMLVNR